MRHQVERLKHVALKHGVKPARALTATLVAVGMMVTGSVVLGSSTANADGGHNNGAICMPTTEPLGDQTSGSGNDEGIATFVGGDMYVGGKKSGITSANNNNAPEGSYAVEAEGLTAVNGKLLLHPMKQAWNIGIKTVRSIVRVVSVGVSSALARSSARRTVQRCFRSVAIAPIPN